MNEREEKPPPKCKAILLCEAITRDTVTQKVSLLGLLTGRKFPYFPGKSEPMRLFLHLVDGIGEYDTDVEVHDLSTGQVIFRAHGKRVAFPQRLAPVRVYFSLPALPIPHAGRYDVVVLANGQEIDRFQFQARV